MKLILISKDYKCAVLSLTIQKKTIETFVSAKDILKYFHTKQYKNKPSFQSIEKYVHLSQLESNATFCYSIIYYTTCISDHAQQWNIYIPSLGWTAVYHDVILIKTMINQNLVNTQECAQLFKNIDNSVSIEEIETHLQLKNQPDTLGTLGTLGTADVFEKSIDDSLNEYLCDIECDDDNEENDEDEDEDDNELSENEEDLENEESALPEIDIIKTHVKKKNKKSTTKNEFVCDHMDVVLNAALTLSFESYDYECKEENMLCYTKLPK
jgi:hypothetical protein